MLSNAYFLANFRFDTAENEPAENLQNSKFCKFAKFATVPGRVAAARRAVPARPREDPGDVRQAGAVGSRPARPAAEQRVLGLRLCFF